MRKRSEDAWKKCPKCGKIENQVKAGYNTSGSQRCKCKEYGRFYTIDPKRHEYPEETRELAIKMYYGGISGRGVGKILRINKSHVMNWIKKSIRMKAETISTAGSKIVELDELYWFPEYKSRTDARENIYIMTMVSRNTRQIGGILCVRIRHPRRFSGECPTTKLKDVKEGKGDRSPRISGAIEVFLQSKTVVGLNKDSKNRLEIL